jgi:hypothetical protein
MLLVDRIPNLNIAARRCVAPFPPLAAHYTPPAKDDKANSGELVQSPSMNNSGCTSRPAAAISRGPAGLPAGGSRWMNV